MHLHEFDELVGAIDRAQAELYDKRGMDCAPAARDEYDKCVDEIAGALADKLSGYDPEIVELAAETASDMYNAHMACSGALRAIGRDRRG